MTAKHKCDACGGKGLLVPAIPSCKILALKHPWVVVEKCDSCDHFTDDLSAGASQFKVVGWFLCTEGGYHALANTRSKRKMSTTNTS